MAHDGIPFYHKQYPVFEVETLFHFLSPDEAWQILPMFQPCINQEVQWNTVHYGRELFHGDQILRVSRIIRQGKTSFWLGWKGPDQGKFANIRVEIEEDITEGINNSSVLSQLGCEKTLANPEMVAAALSQSGHQEFMAFSGKNLTGEYEPLGFHLKLALSSKPALRWSLFLEVEKTAHSMAEAVECETELIEFTHRHLEERVVREEPPTLLYQALHLE